MKKRLLIFISAFCILASILIFLGVNFNSHPLLSHALMGRNFFGGGYKLSIDANKPAIALIALLPAPLIYLACCIVGAMLAVILVDLSQRLGVSPLAGLAAWFLYFFGNHNVIPMTFLSCNWVNFYVPVLFLFFLFFIKKKYTPAAVTILYLGLIRPEAWFFNIVFLYILKFVNKDKIKIPYLIGLTAPLIWIFFDYVTSGNPFFTVYTTSRYAAIRLPPIVPFWGYWLYVSYELLWVFGSIISMAAIVGLLFLCKKKDNWSFSMAMMGIITVTFLFYWMICLKGIYLCPRFFVPVFSLLYFLFFLSFEKVLGKYINQKILAIIFFGVIFLSVPKNSFSGAIARSRQSILSVSYTEQLAKQLKEYLKTHDVNNILVQIRHEEIVIDILGPELSHKLVYMDELANDIRKLYKAVPAVCLYRNTPGEGWPVFDRILEAGRDDEVVFWGVHFRPIYILPGYHGAIYEVS